MSIEIVDIDNIDYDIWNGLRGCHVHQKIWKPFIGQVITFAREEKNSYDRLAISGSAKMPRKIGCVVVGYIPRELSRYMWYASDSGTIISGKVISDKYRPSPLFQGGLEIPIKFLVSWSDEKSMTILKEKVKSVNYPCDMDYVDNSKKIWKDFLGESMYARHQNVIETKEHRASTLFNKHCWHALFCKMSFYIWKKYRKSIYGKLTSDDICSY